MNLKQLEIFCKVVEKRSFSRAAQDIHLSQPTLSEHIKTIEEDFGLKFLDRLGREVVPTQAGKVLYEHAKRILELKLETEHTLNSLKGRLRGELGLGASTIPGEYILPSLLKEFKKGFPQISLNLKIGDTKGIIDALLDNKIEIGVVGAKMENGKLEYHKFVEDEMVLVGSSNYPKRLKESITLGELGKLSFISREEGSGTRIAMEKNLKRAGFDMNGLRIVAKLGSTRAVIEAVKSGVGVSIVSQRAIKEELEYGLLKSIRIEGIRLLRNFYLILRRGKTNSPICKAFLSFLLEKGHLQTQLPLNP